MRKREFRGKTENLSEWVYGNLLGYSTIIPKGQVFEIDEGYIDDQLEAYSVFPETIGQYIGLKDKNGNKIFEGDIVQYDNKDVGYVGYANGAFYIKAENITNEWIPQNLVVIGNIHDNPELEKRINNNVLG